MSESVDCSLLCVSCLKERSSLVIDGSRRYIGLSCIARLPMIPCPRMISSMKLALSQAAKLERSSESVLIARRTFQKPMPLRFTMGFLTAPCVVTFLTPGPTPILLTLSRPLISSSLANLLASLSLSSDILVSISIFRLNSNSVIRLSRWE